MIAVLADLPCVIYVRISAAEYETVRRARAAATAAEREAVLLAKVRAHLEDCVEYAEEHGLDVRERFVERNVSASIRARGKSFPERDKLTAWLRSCTGTVYLLSTEAERFFRDVKKSQDLRDEAARLAQVAPDAELHILTTAGKDYSLSNGTGLAEFNKAMAAAQEEADKASDRRRRG